MDLSEQYKHPKWQKKRLESLEKAEFRCERCYDNETQLHVHHKRYVKGRKIWEYETSELEALCEPCHMQTHAEKDVLHNLLARLPAEAIPEITSLIAGYCWNAVGPAHLDTSDFLVCGGEASRADLWNYWMGNIAGEASHKLRNIYEAGDLLGQLELIDPNEGGKIEVSVEKRKKHFGFDE